MNFSEATDAPVVTVIDGQDVEFPVWTIADLSALAARLDAQRLKKAQQHAARLGVSVVDQVAILQHAEFSATTPADIYRYFCTLSGASECLLQSLKKTPLAEQADNVIGRLTAREMTDLAAMVGRLVRAPRASEAAETGPLA